MSNYVLDRFEIARKQMAARLEIMSSLDRKIEQLKYEIEKLETLNDPDLILNDFVINFKLVHQTKGLNYTGSYSIFPHYKSKILTLLKEVLSEKQQALNVLGQKLTSFEQMTLDELKEALKEVS